MGMWQAKGIGGLGIVLISIGVMGGCRSSRPVAYDHEAEPPPVQATDAERTEAEKKPGESAPVDLVAATIGPQPAQSPAPVTKGVDVEKAAAHTTMEDKSASSDAPSRDVGRPAWWIDSPTMIDGKGTVAAEALGLDIRSTRRAAVAAGREALQQLLGSSSLTDESIVHTTMRRLPAADPGSTGARYVGYVLMSA